MNFSHFCLLLMYNLTRWFFNQDPSASIPKGTLLAILITITSYVVLIVVPGSVQLREASGDVNEYLLNNSLYLNCSLPRNCTKGLYHDKNVRYVVYSLIKLQQISFVFCTPKLKVSVPSHRSIFPSLSTSASLTHESVPFSAFFFVSLKRLDRVFY